MIFLSHVGEEKTLLHICGLANGFFNSHRRRKKICTLGSLQVIFLTHTSDIAHLRACMWFFFNPHTWKKTINNKKYKPPKKKR